MRNHVLQALALSTAMLAVSPAGAAVVFESATVRMASEVRLAGGSGVARRRLPVTRAADTLPANLAARSTVRLSQSGSRALAEGRADASFAAPGMFSFDATSETLIRTGRDRRTRAFAESADYRFTYDFETTTAALFEFDYRLFDPDLERAADRIIFSLDGPTDLLLTLRPNQTGSFASNITAGSYRLVLRTTNYLDHIDARGGRVRTIRGRSDDSFAFLITPVPEPSTWAAMILGTALAGGGVRRRRARIALPAIA